jgi:benzoyl-CoA reductase/2-hydroxyglutaryl-CoA dehydratase subunit BcrC/BadD/HgdB
MKKILLLFLFTTLLSTAHAQFVVSDPTSFAQRLSLFAEELYEIMTDRKELISQTANTGQMLQQAKDAIKKLQKVSSYVQGAKISLDIVKEGINLSNQVSKLSSNLSKLTYLTDEEIANAICFSAELGDHIAEMVGEAKEMLSSSNDKGEMTDYERIQLLKDIQKELKTLRSLLSQVEKRFKDKNSIELVDNYMQAMTAEAIFFGMEKAWDVPLADPSSVVDRVTDKNKKATTSTTSSSKSTKK